MAITRVGHNEPARFVEYDPRHETPCDYCAAVGELEPYLTCPECDGRGFTLTSTGEQWSGFWERWIKPRVVDEIRAELDAERAAARRAVIEDATGVYGDVPF